MVWDSSSRVRPAWPDPELAKMFAEFGCKPEPARIIETNALLTAFNRKRLGQSMRRRFVNLSCGHVAITANRNSMTCPRCVEMMRQGHDYEGWINNRQHAFDGMVWRKDPCRGVNERVDLGGSFLDDPGEDS